MAVHGLQRVVRFLSRTAAVQQNGNFTDAELLGRFANHRDAAAFEVLVWRYGGLVLSVCSRVTRYEQDAEDGFQATFLALANKASTIGKMDSLASWLYKVAFRAALELERKSRRSEGVTLPPITAGKDPLNETIAREVNEILHREVVRLPEKYRLPILMSCFQGRSNQEIARVLRTAEATVRTRLARAREQLRSRLDQKGVHAPALLLALGQGTPSAPSALISATIELVIDFTSTGTGSAAAVWAARRVQQALFVQKIRAGVAAAVLLIGFGSAAGLSLHAALAAKTDPFLLAPVAHEQNKDANSLVGTWERTRKSTHTVTKPGQAPVTETVLSTERWVITPDRIFMVGEDGFVTAENSYKVNPASTPKAIDMFNQRFGTLLGIYQLDQDLLLVCPGSGKVRATQADMARMNPEMTFRRVSKDPAEVTQRYLNAPGCFWMVQPSVPAAMMATLGITYMYEVDKDGAGVITLGNVISTSESRPQVSFRPVLLDEAGQRYLPEMVTGGASAGPDGPGIAMHRWRLAPSSLPATKVAVLGIEGVTGESVRLTAKEAAERAARMNLEVLPWPAADKPFPIRLTTIDGQKLQPDQFRGKVVIVDCWASWCSPCMAKLPEINDLYKKWHKDGLEIIGINLDHDPSLVRRICKTKEITWPQVMVPSEAPALETWRQCVGLESIPRIFVIDRDGILRADTVANLEEEVGKLLKKPAQK